MSSSPDEIDVESARERVYRIAVRSPLVPSVALTERAGVDVHLKLETVQPTNSFKVRGAASRILAIPPAERVRGVVTASTGNHGRAVAYVAHRLAVPATICVSSDVPVGKMAAFEGLGCGVEVVGRSQDEALERAVALAHATGAAFVHPFDDPLVIAGQGTIGAEIVEDLPDVGKVMIPVSGGGLLAGVAGALPAGAAVAVSMSRAPVMALSLAAGHPVDAGEEHTLADSLRGGIGMDNRHTFGLVSRFVDDVTLVDEDGIWAAMRFLFDHHRLIVEGAGAVGVAAILGGSVDLGPGPSVVVVSGANAEPGHIASLVAGGPTPRA